MATPFTERIRLSFHQQEILEILCKRGRRKPVEIAGFAGRLGFVANVLADCEALRILGLLSGGPEHGYYTNFKSTDFFTYKNSRGEADGLHIQREMATLERLKQEDSA